MESGPSTELRPGSWAPMPRPYGFKSFLRPYGPESSLLLRFSFQGFRGKVIGFRVLEFQ